MAAAMKIELDRFMDKRTRHRQAALLFLVIIVLIVLAMLTLPTVVKVTGIGICAVIMYQIQDKMDQHRYNMGYKAAQQKYSGRPVKLENMPEGCYEIMARDGGDAWVRNTGLEGTSWLVQDLPETDARQSALEEESVFQLIFPVDEATHGEKLRISILE